MQLQQLIDNEVINDPNMIFSYSEFTGNLNSSIVSGTQSFVGITELMNSRVSYLQNLNEFSLVPPTISITNNFTATPYTSVNITADIQNSNYVYLGYRFKFADKYEKIQMCDAGNKGDGIEGDGI